MDPDQRPGASSNWIVSTTLDKPDANTRRAIRRHVMRNKNTRGDRQTAKLQQLMRDYDDQWREQQVERRLKQIGYGAGGERAEWTPRTLRQVGTELSLYGFSFEMTPYMLQLIHRAFTIIKPSTYIEQALVGEQPSTILCFDNLAQSPGMMHTVLYSAQAYGDSLSRQPTSNIAQYHLGEALRHLQIALSEDVGSGANMTMVIILSLATAAIMIGDVDGMLVHMDGLHRLVMARGGIDCLGPGSMIQLKAQRLDFGIALATGAKTRFFPEDVSWGPNIALDNATLCPELAPVLGPDPDARLLNVWADLREFCRVANQVTRTGIKMSPGFFGLLAGTVPYRLLNLQYEPLSATELVRLCMLAYTKGLLVQTPGLGKTLTNLFTNLKAAVLAHSSADQVPKPFMLWALFVAALTVFDDFDQEWIRDQVIEVARDLDVLDWQGARTVLKRFLWADLLYDKDGQRLFETWLRPAPS